VMRRATSCILSGFPTLVPPNFIIFMPSDFEVQKYRAANGSPNEYPTGSVY